MNSHSFTSECKVKKNISYLFEEQNDNANLLVVTN